MREQTTLYPAARNLLWVGMGGLVLAGGSAVSSLNWPVGWLATGFLLGSALVALVLGLIPPVEITEYELIQRHHHIPWSTVYQVEKLLWTPLLVRLTLSSKNEVLVVYPGNESSRAALLRHIRRMARGAVIDGVAYREFWSSEASPRTESSRRNASTNRYPLLLADDEAEVERLFQQLKTAGHIEPKKSQEEK